MDFVLARASEENTSPFGLGTRIFFNWYLLDRRRFQVYFDNGVGPNIFLEAFPAGGTQLSFSTFYGLNFAFLSGKDKWIILGIRNLHISNAGIRGKERNPALDGLGIVLGTRLY